MRRLSLAVPLALLLAGCAVGPNYKRPSVAVPDQYRGATADAASIADKKWSDLFDDAALRRPRIIRCDNQERVDALQVRRMPR